jgi:hypothetical protein
MTNCDGRVTLLRQPSPFFLTTLMPDGSPQMTQTWVDTDGGAEHIEAVAQRYLGAPYRGTEAATRSASSSPSARTRSITWDSRGSALLSAGWILYWPRAMPAPRSLPVAGSAYSPVEAGPAEAPASMPAPQHSASLGGSPAGSRGVVPVWSSPELSEKRALVDVAYGTLAVAGDYRPK